MAAVAGCNPSCLCACGQQSCGCRRSATRKPAAPKGQAGPTATCHLCEQAAPMRSFRTPAGQVVVAILCPRCDRTGV